jgi:hypothetical protein
MLAVIHSGRYRRGQQPSGCGHELSLSAATVIHDLHSRCAYRCLFLPRSFLRSYWLMFLSHFQDDSLTACAYTELDERLHRAGTRDRGPEQDWSLSRDGRVAYVAWMHRRSSPGSSAGRHTCHAAKVAVVANTKVS